MKIEQDLCPVWHCVCVCVEPRRTPCVRGEEREETRGATGQREREEKGKTRWPKKKLTNDTRKQEQNIDLLPTFSHTALFTPEWTTRMNGTEGWEWRGGGLGGGKKINLQTLGGWVLCEAF